jgi:cytochrome o ubiquinol oxidase operon protein cyoD
MSRKLVISYIVGYVLSLALTGEAYLLAVDHAFHPAQLVTILLLLAVAQLFVQLFFFLHLDRAIRSPWNIVAFLFMVVTVLTVVLGSLWIMRHLDYSHADSNRATEYLHKNEDL